MSISFELPELEDDLRADYGDLNAAARDALLIDAYRTGRVSMGRLAQVRGTSVSSVLSWLNEHGVGPNYTAEDFAADQEALQSILGSRP
jgi:predicted HTH domain antitoxin